MPYLLLIGSSVGSITASGATGAPAGARRPRRPKPWQTNGRGC